jgi:hypothetical protein
MKSTSLVALFVLGLSGAAQATIIELVPSTSMVALGDSIELELRISGLGDGVSPSLGTYDIDIDHDGSLLQLDAVTVGDPVLGDQLDLFGLGAITSVSFGVNSVNLFELSLDSPADLDDLQAAAFTLATLTYQGIAAGVGSLSLNVIALGDSFGAPLDFEAFGASITVSQAPEPCGVALLLIGVVTTCRLRRHR